MTVTNAYANLTEFKRRIGETTTSQDAYLATLLEAASRQIDSYCGRKFYSTVETRYLTPFLEHEVDIDADLVSVTTLKTDPSGARAYDITWATTDYDLLPDNARNLTPPEPYTRLRVTPATTQFFPRFPRGVQVVGVFGYADYKVAVSTLTAGINSSVTTVPVADGTQFAVGHIAIIGTEQIAVDAISTNNLTVRRGMNDTTAAAHNSADAVSVYQFGAIGEAAYLLANRLKARKDTPLGVSANTLLGQLTVKAPKDDDILALLEGFRRLL